MTSTLIASASTSCAPETLRDVQKPDCNLAIWERNAPAGLTAGLADLLDDDKKSGTLSDVRFTANRQQVRRQLPAEMTASGFKSSAMRDELIADILQLSDRYCDILGLDSLELRLEIISTNSCRKWHSDYVTARLISTYVGSATQWLDDADARRVKGGGEPAHINSMSAGDIGIFKGKLSTDTPAIHRSPPIAGKGETRLLLVLNPPEVA